jgi:hypothetical protein
MSHHFSLEPPLLSRGAVVAKRKYEQVTGIYVQIYIAKFNL